MKLVIAVAMAAIEVFEFLSTMQLVYLLTPEQYKLAIDSTIYSYGAMIVLKLVLLLWLALSAWTTTEIGTCQKIVQAIALWVGSCFLPYGDFFMGFGYKLYTTRHQEGEFEFYP